MAKMQMELERQKKKKSPIADIVSVLIKCIDARISICIILQFAFLFTTTGWVHWTQKQFLSAFVLWIKTTHNNNKCVIITILYFITILYKLCYIIY